MVLKTKFQVFLRETHLKKTVYGTGNKLSKRTTQKQSEENIIKRIRNLFKLKKENKIFKDRIIKEFRTLFKQEDYYYKSTRVGNFWNNNYIE